MGETDRANGRRWYDSSKVIWSLILAMGSIVGMIGSAVWGIASTAKDGVTELHERVNAQEKRLDRIDNKLDTILFEVKKR